MVAVIKLSADLKVMNPLGLRALCQPVDQPIFEQSQLFDVEERFVDVLDGGVSRSVPT